MLIRTAEVVGRVADRHPLGFFPERDCLCVSLRLDRVVPVEPGLRFRMVADDDSGLFASGVIRPWGG